VSEGASTVPLEQAQADPKAVVPTRSQKSFARGTLPGSGEEVFDDIGEAEVAAGVVAFQVIA